MSSYKGDYYIGLDMGTGSIGWAVTDTSYHVLRAKGKDMWGARMFNEASPAVERRMNRVNRRRLEREKSRIHILQEYFSDEISKVDPGFYHRLEESKYWLEDRTDDNEGQKYALFAKGSMGKKDYTDVDYYREFPTIFHLRSELIHNTGVHDVRLVYLALLNMFKHRGHFLNETLGVDEGLDFISAWDELTDSYRRLQLQSEDTDEDELANPFDAVDMDKLKNCFLQKGISKSQIREDAAKILEISKKDKKEYQILSLIVGLTGSLNDIFGQEAFSDAEEKGKHSLNFRKSSYDEDIAAVQEVLDEDSVTLILAAKEVHDVLLLDSIMQGYTYLCDSRIAMYEQHKKDLKLLKNTIKRLIKDEKINPAVYDHLFRTMEDGNYSAYVGSTNSDKTNGKLRRYVPDSKGRNYEPDELYKRIKKILIPFEDDHDVKEILGSIDNETFLRKQLTSANGVIPNQVYVREMKAILKNAKEYLPFLSTVDASGLSTADRILQLFQFHIPYYVGPVGGLANEGNKWAVRKSSEAVMPWNLDSVIDMDKTREAFIENLIRHCTYLNNEKVLPKRSLLYEKFMVLNELNNLKISGESISVQLKQDIYNSLFMSGKPITMKRLCDFLVVRGVISKGENDLVSGIDGTFHNSLTSVGKFNGIFEAPYMDRDHIHMIEDIIRLGTIYGDSKAMFKETIQEKYGKKSGSKIILTDKQIHRISGFKFSDWGRCSRAFLEMTGASKEDGSIRTIIETLWETNDNLMQVLARDRYTYAEELDQLVGEKNRRLSDWTIDDLDDMYLSAPVKRMVWQTLRILREIEEIMGRPPKRVFVEMTRENREKGKKTKSRKSQLIELYRNADLKKEDRDWINELEGHSEQEYRIKKLYLYYCQMGRCMYTNDVIDIDQLMDDNLYDIDHIYPRHFVKDDSIENNLVLVKKQVNNHKQDEYPIEAGIQSKCIGLWRSLLDKKLISKEKYNRLTRRTPFTVDEKVSFVQRQLVETGQGTKAITQILKEALKDDTDIVFSKAGIVSQFRQAFDIYKCRSINDFHHAQDAYLNIVAGNVYFTKFTRNPANFIREAEKNPADSNHKYHLSKMFDYTVKRGSEIAWVAEKGGKDNTIFTIKKQVFKNSPLISRRSYVQSGAITRKDTNYGRQKIKAAKEGTYFPLKTSDPRLADVTKYGGKSDISTLAYTLLKYREGGKEVRSLEAIPLYVVPNGRIDRESILILQDFFAKSISSSSKKECTDFEIVYPEIKLNSLMRIDGYYYYIGGRSGDGFCLYNAVPLKLGVDEIRYVRKIDKAVQNGFYDEIDAFSKPVITVENNNLLFKKILSKINSGIFVNKKGGLNKSITEGQEKFYLLDKVEQCKVLQQIVSSFGSSTQEVDLSLVGQSQHAGKVKISKHLKKLRECVLINQSITGLYVEEVNLIQI